MAMPTRRTFTARYRHGVSDPMPHNAPAAAVNMALNQAAERDDAITAAHLADTDLFLSCPVCNPRPRPVLRPPTRRMRLRMWWHDDGKWWVCRLLWGVR